MNLDKRLIKQVRKSRIEFLITIVLGFIGGLLTVIQAGILSHTIALVYLKNQSLERVYHLLIQILMVIFLRAFLVWGSEVSAKKLAVKIKFSLRHLLAKKIMELGPTYCKGERTGELVNTAVEGVETLDAYFRQYLPALCLAAIVPLTVVIMVLPVDLLSGLILIFTAPLIPLFMALIGNLSQRLTRKQWTSLSRMSAYFLDILQGITTLKFLGRSKDQVNVIADVSERFRVITMRILRVTFLSALVLELVATLSTAVVAVEIGVRLLYGRLPFEQAFFILILAPEFYYPLRMLGARFHAGMSGVAASERIFQVLDTPTPNKQKPIAFNEPQSTGKPPSVESSIRFNNIYLEYIDRKQALSGVSFIISSGQKVALVGPSGSGKTSIANLLLGFVRPQKGTIMIGEHDLDDISKDWWRSQISWVSQNPYLFYGTVAENIHLANPHASMDQIFRAALLANAHDFITDLPEGFDTIIGEQGTRLSAGQAQRIALARAFLRNSDFIILDEPTANLDPESESNLQYSLDKLLRDRGALIIAHRLNTVKKVDQILVLQNGQIVQRGKHEELAKKSGLYQRLINAYQENNKFDSLQPTEKKYQETNITSQEQKQYSANYFFSSAKPFENTFLDDFPKAQKSRSIGDFNRLLGFMKPFKGWVALSVLLGFAAISSGIGLMMTSAYIISAAALQPSIAELQVAIVGVRFFGITRGIFRYLERYSSHQVTFRLLAKLKVWFYQSLEPLAPARLMHFRSGDLLTRIIADIESLENFYVRVLAPPIVALLIAFLMFFIMAGFYPYLGLVLFGLLFLSGVLIPVIIRLFSQKAGQEAVDQKTSLNIEFIDFIQGLSDLLVFGKANQKSNRINHLSKNLGKTQMKMARIDGLRNSLILLISNLSLWLMMLLAIPLVYTGRLAGVYLAVIALAAYTCFEVIDPLPLAAQYLDRNLYSARRLFDIVDTKPEVNDPLISTSIPGKFDLVIKKLSFSYPPNKKPKFGLYSFKKEFSLQNIDLTLPVGQKIAIVGPSGSGKSTLVSLLNRFWDYHEGEILLNGNELHSLAQDDIRRKIAVVSQNTYLFNANIRDNIRIANPSAEDYEIIEAARMSEIHHFIETLPEGYYTWIGEQGMKLSGGERQRIAIARALLTDPHFLILDEPTANLDPITERKILQTIFKLMEKRSVLLITHRLIEMDIMDEIIVLVNGCVVERGKHRRLLQAGGIYSRMWHLQNQIIID